MGVVATVVGVGVGRGMVAVFEGTTGSPAREVAAAPLVTSSAPRRVPSCAIALVFSSVCAVSRAIWLSIASRRARISVTAVVEGRTAVLPAGCAAVTSGSKYLPSLPGKTLRWSARISVSAFRSLASVDASCAVAGQAAAAIASTASGAAMARFTVIPIEFFPSRVVTLAATFRLRWTNSG